MPENRISEIRKGFEREATEHQLNFDEKTFENALNVIKKDELRRKYFKFNQDDLLVFTDPNIYNREVKQSCDDGGFETWPVINNPYVFKSAVAPFLSGSGQDINTFTEEFSVFTVGNTVDNINAPATLVSNIGFDTVVPTLSKVLNGTTAIKLNFPEVTTTGLSYNIVTMSRNMIINQNSFDFNYSVILNEPSDQSHLLNQKPFFLVRIYDSSNNILRSINILTNPQDCSLQSITNSTYNGTILYAGWQCARINTADLIGENVKVEFIVGDCMFGQHFGTVYIDDICQTNCSNPLFGAINLNPIQNIFCPTTTQTICGTFQTPFNTVYTSMQLNIKNSGMTTVGVVNAPSAINLTNSTFCFTVPLTAFGANPTGNFEFEVIAYFTRQCTINFQMNPISDSSANDTGPDVSFNPIIPLFFAIDPICYGGYIDLPQTSIDGISGTWSPAPNNMQTTTYTFTANEGQCIVSPVVMTVEVTAGEIPIFNPIGPVCVGSKSYSLPTTSLNGISGTWSPAINNMPTTTYTFTPTNSSCASTVTMTVSILPIVTPTFNPIAPFCINAALSPLPTTSTNGITGTWSPAFNNLATTTYVFTPTTGSCASTATITLSPGSIVAVNDSFVAAPINTLTGGASGSVLTNDFLNGLPISFNDVSIQIVSVTPPIAPVPTISANGIITIPQGTPIGNYNIIYKITRNGCAANTSTATALIAVNEPIIVSPPIQPGVRANSIVSLVDTQGGVDGKIIIAGYFTSYNNISCINIARLNSNLTLDTSGFTVSGPAPVGSIPLDMKVIKTPGADYNKILLVGNFTSFNGNSNGKGIIRLNPNGTVDQTFNAAYSGVNKGTSGINSQIRTVFIFPNGHALAGKILIGGMFDKYNNNPAPKLALLNADGSFVSGSFNTAVNTIINPLPIQSSKGFSSSPQAIDVQSDGNIIIGGYFNWFNGVPANNILRLTVTGALDPTFNSSYMGVMPGVSYNIPLKNGRFINKLVIHPANTFGDTDKIFIGGVFSHYNNSSRNNIARLNANGTLDDTFNVGSGFNNDVTSGMVRDMFLDTATLNNVNLYVSGDFTKYKGAAVNEIIRIKCSTAFLPGAIDLGFNLLGGGPNGSANGPVWCMKRQSDNKIIIGGGFTTYGPFSALNVTRIMPSVSSGEARMSTTYYDSEPEIDLFAKNNLIIYPNPSTGIVYFTSENIAENNYTIIINNVLGQKVYEKSGFTPEENIIDVTDLTNGTYFINFITKKKTITKKLMKQ